MNNIRILSAAASLGVLLLSGCGNGNKWTVKGELDPAAGNMIAVEASDNGRWYVLDSVKVSDSGKFSFSHEAMGYPDVYRLRNDNVTVYFPVDSIETVSVSHDGGRYMLAGTPQADMMMKADSIIALDIPEPEMKNALARLILTDPSSITSYYAINRKIAGKPLFDPAVKKDLRVIGAVANAYNEQRPADPRSAYLKRLYLSSRRQAGEGGTTVLANEINAPEINLYDNTGVRRSLNELASQGKVVVLNFTSYVAEESPAFNLLLNSIYEKYHGAGLEIYQVALDDDEYNWKRSADNLPWITVINDAHNSSQVLLDYNVGSIPTVFILNRNGDVVERVTDLGELEKLVAKYM
ncbi:MAG: AhpC/TSA family protein [Duncaniella sp.]|nr:AhpC/TSA family protein [Duncaniella sp.]